MEERDINTIFDEILLRKRFNYNVKDIFNYLMQCICLRRSLRKLKWVNDSYKRHFLYRKADEKLE
jgi:hypothetical protein